MENGFGDHLLSGDEYVESGVVMEGRGYGNGNSICNILFLHIKISEAHAEAMAIM